MTPEFSIFDVVLATYRGRTVTAVVTLASEKSLMIDWAGADDGLLGRDAGMMPLLRYDDGTYHSLIGGDLVELERKAMFVCL